MDFLKYPLIQIKIGNYMQHLMSEAPILATRTPAVPPAAREQARLGGLTGKDFVVDCKQASGLDGRMGLNV